MKQSILLTFISLQIEELQERIENDIEYASQAKNAIESAQSSLFSGFDRIFGNQNLTMPNLACLI